MEESVADRFAALFAFGAYYLLDLYPPWSMYWLQQFVRIDPTVVAERFDIDDVRAVLASADFLIIGWGCPSIIVDVLDLASWLQAVLYTAGLVKAFLFPAFWERGLAIISAAVVNAVPVAEYTVAAILFAGKNVFGLRDRYYSTRHFILAEV